MKRLLIRSLVVLALGTASGLQAQDEVFDAGEALQVAREFVEENVDPEALAALGVDEARAQQFLKQLQTQFAGEYIFDLPALGQTATNIVPLLEQFEETQPYASWLKTRLDYFTTLDELRRLSPATNKPAARLPNPSPASERKVWKQAMTKRPMPPRAQQYVPTLKPIFASQRVPQELVWLAEVESSFDPRARSPAGAAGLYQLMPATAKSLELSLWPRDERLQPEKNARAAAAYLRQLHNRFKDWPLALAAYNAGETRVAGLLKKHNAKSFDAIADKLPAETQLYVPKVEATVRKREGRELSELKVQ